jgi:hypothetical protein
MLALAIVAAVAGGSLAVTTSPRHPHVGHALHVAATGEVGDRGRLYIYRNTSRACAQSARGERRRGILLVTRALDAPFEIELAYMPRRARREWVCSYLYGVACDAAGRNCAIPTALPPDAGFSQIPVRIGR